MEFLERCGAEVETYAEFNLDEGCPWWNKLKIHCFYRRCCRSRIGNDIFCWRGFLMSGASLSCPKSRVSYKAVSNSYYRLILKLRRMMKGDAMDDWFQNTATPSKGEWPSRLWGNSCNVPAIAAKGIHYQRKNGYGWRSVSRIELDPFPLHPNNQNLNLIQCNEKGPQTLGTFFPCIEFLFLASPRNMTVTASFQASTQIQSSV